MDETELTDRLHDLGTHAVPADVQASHLHRMSAAAPASARRGFGRLAVAAAALIGFAFGSTGLAMAGALPDTAQDVAHDVLGVVNLAVPEGTRGQCVSEVAKSDRPEAEKKAAKDACPKGGRPDGTGNGKSGQAPGQTRADKHAGDPCRGKPPWAGNKDISDGDKTAMQADRGRCPADVEDGPEIEEQKAEQPETEPLETDEPESDEPQTDEPAPDEPETDEPQTEEPAPDDPASDEPETDEPGS